MTSSVEVVVPSTWPDPWLDSHHDGRKTFATARELMLNLVQWPARIANSYVSSNDRLVLDFHSSGAIVTQTFDDEIALELRLPSLELQFRERGKLVPHLLDPEERSPAEVEAWILVELLHRGVDRDMFSKSLPYKIPNLMSGDAEDYSPRVCKTGLVQLTSWLCAASSVLSNRGRVVCLPQTVTLLASGEGPAVGFLPGDAECDEPYFFRGGEGKRAKLTASELAKEKNPAMAAAQFINATTDVMRA